MLGDPLYCLGVHAATSHESLDALIADAKAAGKGTLRDETATPAFPAPEAFPGQVTETRVKSPSWSLWRLSSTGPMSRALAD